MLIVVYLHQDVGLHLQDNPVSFSFHNLVIKIKIYTHHIIRGTYHVAVKYDLNI